MPLSENDPGDASASVAEHDCCRDTAGVVRGLCVMGSPGETQSSKNPENHDHRRPSPFGSFKERLSVLKALQSSSATYPLATSFEGMYGENRISYIGSGRGLPVAVIAVLAGVHASLGIEVDETAYYLSLQTLIDLQCLTVEHRLREGVQAFRHSGDCPISLLCIDAVLLTSLDPVTHVFNFDLAMPGFMVDKFVRLFNESQTAVVYVTFRRDIAEFHIDAQPICQVPMEMIASSEKHRATIYVKESYLPLLRKLWQERNLFTNQMATDVGFFDCPKPTFPECYFGCASPGFLAPPCDISSSTNDTIKFVAKPGTPEISTSLSIPSQPLPRRSNEKKFSSTQVELDWQRIAVAVSESETLSCAICQRALRVSPSLLNEQYRRVVQGSLIGENHSSRSETAVVTRRKRSLSRLQTKQSRGRCTDIRNQEVSPLAIDRWVCCDVCGTWRSLPGCPLDEYKRIQMAPYWTCSMNRWDALQATCHSSQGLTERHQALADTLFWAQCENCNKWRSLPGCSVEAYQTVQQAAVWVCSMNRWDPLRASCSAPEQANLDSSSNVQHVTVSRTKQDYPLPLYPSPVLPNLTPTGSASDPFCVSHASELTTTTSNERHRGSLKQADPNETNSLHQSSSLDSLRQDRNAAQKCSPNVLFLPYAIASRHKTTLVELYDTHLFNQPYPYLDKESSSILSVMTYNPTMPASEREQLDVLAQQKLKSFLGVDYSILLQHSGQPPNSFEQQAANQQPADTGVLARMVTRCRAPLLQQLECAHLEVGLWLSRRKRSRQRVGPKRVIGGVNATASSSVQTKVQLYTSLAEALDLRWKLELQEQTRLKREGKWCTCNPQERCRGVGSKVPVVYPSSVLVMRDSSSCSAS